MPKCYFELRKQAARGTDSIAADVMRHLHARQHLGKTVIVCDQPAPFLAASRKQWLKLTRTIQRQRSSTLNADKILKYTHAITRMQHMRFSAQSPLEEPDAEIYFVDPSACTVLPSHCYSLYITCKMSRDDIDQVLNQLPEESLIIDYEHSISWSAFHFEPKIGLEERVKSEWSQVSRFLTSNHIAAKDLLQSTTFDVESMDTALDTLLGVSAQFLRVASEFQRALELARPLRMSQATRQEYDAVVLLAYRVQALSPGSFTQRFLETYNEDDTFFLYDYAKRSTAPASESLAEAVTRHLSAGRTRLAAALKTTYS